jgi:hypothetical protein
VLLLFAAPKLSTKGQPIPKSGPNFIRGFTKGELLFLELYHVAQSVNTEKLDFKTCEAST